MRKAIITADEPGELPEEFEGWFWFNPSTGEICEFEDGGWVLKETLSLASHSHPTHGNINFTGSISADGDAGLTGQRTIARYTLTFKKGLLVGFQAS